VKKRLLVMAMLVAGVGRLAADSVPPQLLLDLDGSVGVKTEPSYEAGHGIGGGSGGFEYMPAQVPNIGFDVDYHYLAVGKYSWARDNDIDISMRGFGPSMGIFTGWLQAGIGYNTTENFVNTHYAAFIEPGVRVVLFPRLAFDGGIQYFVSTPDRAFMQAFSLTLGLSIPLDGSYGSSDQTSSDAEPAAAAEPVAVVEPVVVAQPVVVVEHSKKHRHHHHKVTTTTTITTTTVNTTSATPAP
jgi:hypothetical protein